MYGGSFLKEAPPVPPSETFAKEGSHMDINISTPAQSDKLCAGVVLYWGQKETRGVQIGVYRGGEGSAWEELLERRSPQTPFKNFQKVLINNSF